MRLLLFAAMQLAASASLAQAPEGRVVIPSQGQGTITLYDRPDFGGTAVVFRQTESTVRVPFIVRSIRAEGVWRVCSGQGLTGRCFLADGDYRDSQRELGLILAIGSVEARSADHPGQGAHGGSGGWGGHGHPGSGWGGAIGGPTLRGMAVQFYPAPEVGGRRVESCPEGGWQSNCAVQVADRFCALAGWRRAQSYGEQVMGRRSYLADVLCANR